MCRIAMPISSRMVTSAIMQQASTDAAELDAAPAAGIDEGQQDHRIDPPVERGPAVRRHHVVEEEAEHAAQADLDGGIGRQRDHRAGHADDRAQSGDDVGIEPAAAADETAHRREAGAEQQVEDTDQQEGQRHARPVAQREDAGVTPTTAVKGAAAATTKKTICGTPSASLRRASMGISVEMIAQATSRDDRGRARRRAGCGSRRPPCA